MSYPRRAVSGRFVDALRTAMGTLESETNGGFSATEIVRLSFQIPAVRDCLFPFRFKSPRKAGRYLTRVTVVSQLRIAVCVV